jgi:thiamine-phosphate pyrophosphorylase
MAANQSPWPREWLMTDERLGDRLWEALERLPAGAGGVVFRHAGLDPADRLALGQEVAAVASARGLTLAVARSQTLAEELGAQLVHNPDFAGKLPFSRSVHEEGEAITARDAGASLVFISPVFPTRSHPDRPPLGIGRALTLANLAGVPAIALGGMNAERFESLSGQFHGYAGIDCWLD